MNHLKSLQVLFATCFIFSFAQAQTASFSIEDFYTYDPVLEHEVDRIFHSLNDTTRVAQMIVTSAGKLGKSDEVVYKLAMENKIGGVVFLKGTKESHKEMVDSLDRIAAKRTQLPLLFSSDAEPSLFNGRLEGTQEMMHTIDITDTKICDSVAHVISDHLREIGFRQNFAPVCDLSPGNEAIKNRSFGSDKARVIELSKQFIKTTQEHGVIATAKHFPGHGLVKGDTHKKSVYIDGALKELDVYPPLIEAGVLSVMIAHITVVNNPKYDTNGLPASCSRNIVTDLLKGELGFKGLVITDAMNIMKAVTIIEDAPLLASKSGCDMLLMPIDEGKVIQSILNEMETNPAYKQQVYQSVKKIIRMKICLGLIDENTLFY